MSKKTRNGLVGWLLAAALAAILGVTLVPHRAVAELGARPLPSPVIFPKQQIPLSFSHEKHLSRDKMDCAFCHESAPDSISAADNNMPTEEACTTCHEIERDKPDKQVEAGKPGAKCSLCHTGWKGPSDGAAEPPRIVVPPPNLKFNHKIHVDKKIRCQTCHGDLLKEKVGLATRAQLPTMPLCLTCHDSKKASAKCTTCHLADAGGYVKTNYAEGDLMPSGVLRGDAHDLRFRTDHARVAANDQKYCANCHKKDFCLDCHNSTQKPMDFHGGDYVNMHTIDARRNNPDCNACHRRETFCTGCHTRAGISQDAKTTEFNQQSDYIEDSSKNKLFHPKGWYKGEEGPRDGSHHSFQAQRNIRTCVSCHRETFCKECHGASVNPHPVNWATSARCKSLREKSGRMCLKCHIDVDDTACE